VHAYIDVFDTSDINLNIKNSTIDCKKNTTREFDNGEGIKKDGE
jgi:hypothetical protein